MNQQQVIAALQTLLPDIRESGDPGGTLIKYARAKRLPNAQFEKLAQVFNTLRTISHFSKNGSTRGDSFDILDVPELLKSYGAVPDVPMRKAASVALADPVSFRVPDFTSRGAPTLKAASEEAAPVESEPLLAHNILAKQAAERKRIELHLSMLDEIKSDALFNVRDSHEKLANFCRVKDPECFATMEQDAMGMFGDHDTVKAAFDKLEVAFKHMRIPIRTVKRASELKHRPALGYDRTGAGDLLTNLFYSRSIADGAVAMMEQVKSGAVGVGVNAPPAPAPTSNGPGPSKLLDEVGRGSAKGPELGKPVGDIAGAMITGVGGLAKTLAGTAEGSDKSMVALTDALDPDQRNIQKMRDDAVSHIRDTSTLQRLILNDPIISSADPTTVISLYNSIHRSNPALAQDPNALSYALREALQYEGIPLHERDTLLKQRTSEAQGIAADKANRDSRYAPPSLLDNVKKPSRP